MDVSVSERDHDGESACAEEERAAGRNSSSYGPHPSEAGSRGLPARCVHPDRGVPHSPFSGTGGRSSGHASGGLGQGQQRTPPLNLSGTTDVCLHGIQCSTNLTAYGMKRYDITGLRLPPLSIVTSGVGQGKVLRPDHAGSSAMASTSAAHRTMSSSLHLSPSTLKASMTTQTRVERNFRKAKNMVNRELVAFLTETTNAMSRLEESLPDEQLWHVEHAMGVAQRCIQEPLERFKESVKGEVDQLEELRRELDGDSAFCKRMYAKLLFVLSHCSRLMATHDENSPGVAGTPACFKAARTKRERRSSVKAKRDGNWGAGRSGSGGNVALNMLGEGSGRSRSGVSSSLLKQQVHGSVLAADGQIRGHKMGPRIHSKSPSVDSSPRGMNRSRSPGSSPTYTPVIRQLQELHLVGLGDASLHRDLGIPEVPVAVTRTMLANMHHQQTPSTPPSGGGLSRHVRLGDC